MEGKVDGMNTRHTMVHNQWARGCHTDPSGSGIFTSS